MHTISSTLVALLSGALSAAVLSLFAAVGIAFLVIVVAVLWMSLVYVTLDRLVVRRGSATDRRGRTAEARR